MRRKRRRRRKRRKEGEEVERKSALCRGDTLALLEVSGAFGKVKRSENSVFE